MIAKIIGGCLWTFGLLFLIAGGAALWLGVFENYAMSAIAGKICAASFVTEIGLMVVGGFLVEFELIDA